MTNEQFFTESSEQSRVKTAIVSKYFWAWAKVVMPSAKRYADNKIAYIDLFAGPGYRGQHSVDAALHPGEGHRGPGHARDARVDVQ